MAKRERDYHVKATAKIHEGEDLSHIIPVTGRGRFSDGHLEDLAAKLPDYPGMPVDMSVHTDKNGVPGRRVRGRRVNRGVAEAAKDHTSSQEIVNAKSITNQLHPGIRELEESFQQLLPPDDRIGDKRYDIVRQRMYGDHEPIPDVVAEQLVAHPEVAIAETIHYLNVNHVQHKDRHTNLLEKSLERFLLGTGEVPIAGPVSVAIINGLRSAKNILLDPGGTARGKKAELEALGLNITGNGIAAATDVIVVGELIAMGVNIATNPEAIRKAVTRVNDERYMLQAKAAIEFMQSSAISLETRRNLSQAVLKYVGKGLLNKSQQVEKENKGQSRAYFAGLIKELTTAAQAVR